MKINGYELNLSEEQLDEMLNDKLREIDLVSPDFAGYRSLPETEKKVLPHLVKAARIMNDVSLEQDHPLNRSLKKGLEDAARNSSQRPRPCVCLIVLTVLPVSTV